MSFGRLQVLTMASLPDGGRIHLSGGWPSLGVAALAGGSCPLLLQPTPILNVSASLDDVFMGISAGFGVGLEGVHASAAALDALTLEDASLVSGAGVGADVNVLQRRYEIRLERMEITARLEAQLAAVKARDAAEAIEFQHAMTPPDASVRDRS
jgi:hypothetical protein